MAVTITRTPWVDDDGTGTTGTVINNAVKTALYNEIDGALAKVAQLAGGNAFTGNQTIAGNLIMPTPSQLLINYAGGSGAYLSVASDQTVRSVIVALQNTNAAGSLTYILFQTSTFAQAGAINQSGATVNYGTTSDARLKTDHGRAADLTALRGVVVHDFTWTADDVRDRGVFAQDVHALYPRAVSPGDDTITERGDLAHPWMTDYSKFVPDLIVGWQQHDAELVALRARLAAVTGAGV